MELKTKKLTEIHPYPGNPRKNDGAVDAVAESIRQCGYVAPIIVDEEGVILAGHTRYKALQKVGYTEAQVIVKEGLTEEQKKKFRLLDNKTNELADWDFGLLAQELEGLDFGALSLDWDVYGISDDELDDLMREEVERRVKERHRVVVDCDSEDEAEAVALLLKKQGYKPTVQNS